MASAGKFMDDLVDGVKSVGTTLRSNEAINSLGKNMGGAFEAAGYMMRKENPLNFGQALHKTFANNYDDLYDEAGKRIAGQAAELNYGKIAGSYIGTAAAMRVVSGGGVHKDQHGNSNLIGVPFI